MCGIVGHQVEVIAKCPIIAIVKESFSYRWNIEKSHSGIILIKLIVHHELVAIEDNIPSTATHYQW